MKWNVDKREDERMWSWLILTYSALEPTHFLSNGYRRLLPLEVKRPEREVDHSPPFSAEVKNAWKYTSTALISLHGVMIS